MSSADSQTAAQDDGGHTRHVADYAVPLLLFALGVVLGLVALLLVPTRATLRSPIQTSIALTTSAPVNHVALLIVPPRDQSPYYSLTADVDVTPVTEPQDWSAQLILNFGKPVHVISCPPEPTSCGSDLIQFVFTLSHAYRYSSIWEMRESVRLNTASNLMIAGNGENVTGDLPGFSAAQPTPSIVTTWPNPDVTIDFEYPNAASYDWSGGTVPPTVSDDSVEWDISPYPTTLGMEVSAVNPDAQTSDAIKTFLAGALVGIAGAALIGGLTELLHVHPQVRTTGWLRRRRNPSE
jgi:hypothetical protein